MLLRIGGRQYELDVARRLFERFQHRIEGVAREHVHFVDDVDLEAPAGRRVERVFQQLAHVVDLRIRGSVEFDQVDVAAGVDIGAGAALAAGLGADAGFAIERLGDNARQRGLADAAGAGEQVGVMQPLLGERIGQRPDDVLLPDQFGKRFGPPLAGEDLGHDGSVLALRANLRGWFMGKSAPASGWPRQKRYCRRMML